MARKPKPKAKLKVHRMAVGFHYAWDEASREWAHMAAIFVLTPDGKVSRYLYGIDYPPKDFRL